MLCLTLEEEDAGVCFGEFTFPSYHCKTLSFTLFIHWLFFPSRCFAAPLPFFSFSCSLHLLCVLLFQTHLPSLYISLLILIPPFFSHSLFHQSDPHSCASSHSPHYLSHTWVLVLFCPYLSLSLPTTATLLPSPYLSSHPCFPSVWLEKLLWIIDW